MNTATVARALVVEDDRPIRETLRWALEEAGYEVGEAEDGLAALDALRASPQRMVVLLDLRMPRLDGAGVLRAVASDRQLSTRHAYILMTADRFQPTVAFAQLLATLHVAVMRKPFDLDELLDTLERATGRLTAA
jgi:CheY-like chemotaxis protein